MREWVGMAWVLIPLVAIVGGILSSMLATSARARVRELEIRERIALIEKGLVPPPEVDPRGFDQAMGRYDGLQRLRGEMVSGTAGRHRRVGIILLGVGLGLMVLIGFSGSPDEGFAIGGFLCVLGLAFLINSFFEWRSAATPSSTQPSPPNSPIK